MGSHYSSEILINDLVKFYDLDHQSVLGHTFSNTDSVRRENSTRRNDLESRSKALVKKKVPRRVIKNCAATAVLMETNSEIFFSYAQNHPFRKRLTRSDQLPEVIVLQNVHEGKMVFERSSIRQIGLKLISGPTFCTVENYNSSREADAPTFSGTKSSVSSKDVSTDDEGSVKDKNGCMDKVPLKSISVIRRELPESSTLGWPLLRRSTLGHAASRRSKARSMSLTEWVLSLPRRYSDTIMQNHFDSDIGEASISFNRQTEVFLREESTVNESDDGSISREDEECGLIQGFPACSVPELTEESTLSTPGWPLLRIKTFASVDSLGESASSKELVATSHSKISAQHTQKSQIDSAFKEEENSAEKDFCYWEEPGKLTKKLKLVRKLMSYGCKQFSYEELERATHIFSSENIIGEGGCSNVYKGSLRWGKLVAIKVLKQYKEAWDDFSLEAEIMSSLKHRHITSLIGVCIEDDHLILVYNFLSKGSLEELLQGHNEMSILPWKMRFKVATAVAEALNYLHNECSCPVIHRDVKSSNILLSRDFKPQLSDFGLATWGVKDSAYMISRDVVGTFGYIAPEYFMHGRISDKTDIYSFGIVLLELLTGKKPINSEGLEGQESLVKWATPLLESRNLEALLDSKLGGEFDVAQVRRMVLAAALCTKQSPRIRPKASQILKLLREEKETREWTNANANDLKEPTNDDVDDFSSELYHNPCSDSFSSLVLDDGDASLSSADTRSPSIAEHKHRLKLKVYLKEQQK